MKSPKYSKEIIKLQLIQAKNLLDEIPSSNWWLKNSKKFNFCSQRTVVFYFNSWNNAILETFGYTSHATPRPSVLKVCTNCNKILQRKPSTLRSDNFFCSQSCAATYNNKNKKYGTRRSKLEIYLEEQLRILYPDLEFHFNQKDTINSELDIYIPSLKLAFELNGIFHYEPIYGEDKLSKIQNNDQRKFQACIENGIELCIIDTSQVKYLKKHILEKYLKIISNVIELKMSKLLTLVFLQYS